MYRGAYRIGSASCNVTKKYIFNNRWRVVKGSQFFSSDGKVVFKHTVPKIYHGGNSLDSLYRQYHQVHFASNAVVWARTNENVSLALGRLLSLRFADDEKLQEAVKFGKPVLHFNDPTDRVHVESVYRRAQEDFIYLGVERSNILADWILEEYSDAYLGIIYEALMHVGDKHPKRELRIKAMGELIESGNLGEPLWLRSVLYKMKTEELAKPGKWPRMIGDLGVAASLQGFRSTAFLKEAMNKKSLIYKGFEIEFVKSPSYERLVSTFKKLLDPPQKRGYMVLFSDDSCASIRLSDGRVMYGNLDISGCDASQTAAIFRQLEYISPGHMQPDIGTLINQCKLPIRIVNMNDRREVCKLKNVTGDPVLYSGSTLTTIVNNLANFNIGMSIADDLEAGIIKSYEDMITCAAKVGYVVTCEACKQPQEIQFLKHSPVYDVEGELRPLLNLGVLLRSSGTSKGDLPGRKSETIEARAASFQKGLLRGMYPGARFSILQALNSHVAESDVSSEVERVVAKHLPYDHETQTPVYFVDDHQLSLRYELALSEIEELNWLIRQSGFGYQIQSSAVDKILRVDYGLRSLV